MADSTQCAECQRLVTGGEEIGQKGGWFSRAADTNSGVRIVYVCEGCLTDETRAHYVRLTEESPEELKRGSGAAVENTFVLDDHLPPHMVAISLGADGASITVTVSPQVDLRAAIALRQDLGLQLAEVLDQAGGDA